MTSRVSGGWLLASNERTERSGVTLTPTGMALFDIYSEDFEAAKQIHNNNSVIDMTKLIIDTDIGTDVDDTLALAYAIKSGMDIPLITTVHGNTISRARIARKVTRLLGVDIPIVAGAEKPLVHPYVFWTGLEGKDFLGVDDSEPIRTNAVEALAECILQHQNNISIAAIAPMTNLGKLFQQFPDLASYVNHIYIMGNAILCDKTYHLNYRAHNLKIDPHAADIVFGTSIPKTIVTTEVCKQLSLSKDDLERLNKTGEPLFQYIHNSALRWMNFINYDVTYLYDPLVVHHVIDDAVTTKVSYGPIQITVNVNPEFKNTLMQTLLKK